MKTLSGKTITLSLALFLCSTLFSTVSVSEPMSDGDAINKAGRQRMLSQRITKAYLQIANDIDYVRSKKQLDQGLALFEEQLMELQDNAPTQEITQQLNAVEVIWNDFRKIALTRSSKSNAIKLIEKSDTLLTASHQAVVLWEASANSNANKMVNIAGRQRMLSQRIGKFYAAHYFGIKTDDIVNGLNQALVDYEKGLKLLSSSGVNHEELQSALKKVSNQWEYSKQGLSQINQGNYVPHVISVTTESMLKRMNKITGMYSDLSSDLSSDVQYSKSGSRQSTKKINIPGLASTTSSEF